MIKGENTIKIKTAFIKLLSVLLDKYSNLITEEAGSVILCQSRLIYSRDLIEEDLILQAEQFIRWKLGQIGKPTWCQKQKKLDWSEGLKLPACWVNDTDGLLEKIKELIEKCDTTEEVIGNLVMHQVSVNDTFYNVEDVFNRALAFLPETKLWCDGLPLPKAWIGNEHTLLKYILDYLDNSTNYRKNIEDLVERHDLKGLSPSGEVVDVYEIYSRAIDVFLMNKKGVYREAKKFVENKPNEKLWCHGLPLSERWVGKEDDLLEYIIDRLDNTVNYMEIVGDLFANFDLKGLSSDGEVVDALKIYERAYDVRLSKMLKSCKVEVV